MLKSYTRLASWPTPLPTNNIQFKIVKKSQFTTQYVLHTIQPAPTSLCINLAPVLYLFGANKIPINNIISRTTLNRGRMSMCTQTYDIRVLECCLNWIDFGSCVVYLVFLTQELNFIDIASCKIRQNREYPTRKSMWGAYESYLRLFLEIQWILWIYCRFSVENRSIELYFSVVFAKNVSLYLSIYGRSHVF